MYVLDADALIIASRHDFPIGTNPGTFWTFLEDMGEARQIRIPEAVYDEIQRNDEGLYDWLNARRDKLFLPKDAALPYITMVLDAYGHLSDIQLEQLNGKADPYLIAHALASGATVVTNEVPRPSASNPLNKKIPDICTCLSVTCVRYPRFLWDIKP